MFNNRDNFTLFLIVLFLSGVYLFVFSESGALERVKYNEKRNRIISNIEKLKQENRQFETGGPGSLKDISDDELFKSGYIRDGAKLLFINIPEKKESNIVKSDYEEDMGIEVGHLRVMWLVLSALIILLYMINRYRNRE